MATRGGARDGAGRKSRAAKNATPIEQAEQQIKDCLPEIIDIQLSLARGGIRVVEEKWVPSWYLLLKQREQERNNSNKARTGADDLIDGALEGFVKENTGKTVESNLVMIERKVTETLPDRAAGQYLTNRILGAPSQKINLKYEKMTNGELIEFIKGTPGSSGGS